MGGVISSEGGEGGRGRLFVALKVARLLGRKEGKGREGDNRGDIMTRRAIDHVS